SSNCGPVILIRNGVRTVQPVGSIFVVAPGDVIILSNGTVVPATAAAVGSRFQVVRQPGCGIGLPIMSRGAFKIAENESAAPQDRVFVTYNFYDNLNGSLRGPDQPRVDLHRETFGFEKSFLDGNASFGMRLPYLQVTGGEDMIRRTDLAD